MLEGCYVRRDADLKMQNKVSLKQNLLKLKCGFAGDQYHLSTNNFFDILDTG